MILDRSVDLSSVAFTCDLVCNLIAVRGIRPPGQGDDDDIVETNQSKPLSNLTVVTTESTIAGMRRLPLALLVFIAAPAFAQTPGRAAFVIYEKGQRVGTMETTVSRTDEGWRIQSSMQTKGTVPVRIVNLDLLYDRNWFGRWMTMEMTSPDEVIVHVAVSRVTAHTDVVRSRDARFRSSSVSPNTILLPERAYGAYEAVAARLASDPIRSDLPIFVPPTGETRAAVASVVTERMQTTAGMVPAQHYVITEIRLRPTRVDLWADRGRLLRLDLPAAQISVVRSDVRR